MKKLIYGVATFAFLLIGCEKDSVDSPVNQNQHQASVRKVTIEDVPFLQSAIDEAQRERRSTNRGIEDLELDLAKIIEYSQANGYKSFSIGIVESFADKEDYYFQNLHIIYNGDEYKSFVAKYNAEDDSKKFDLSTFTGTIELSDLQNLHKAVVELQNGAANKLIDLTLPTPPFGDDPWYTGGGGSDGGGDFFTGIWNWIREHILGQWNGNPDNINPSQSGGDSSSGSSSNGSSQDYSSYFFYISPGNFGSGPTSEGPNQYGGGTGSIATVVNPVAWPSEASSFIKGKLLAGYLNLDSTQKSWLQNTAHETQATIIYNYVRMEAVSAEENQLAVKVLNAVMQYFDVFDENETTKDVANDFMISVLVPNDEDVEGVTTAPPSCESFNFTPLGTTNWQLAAVKNIHFNIILADHSGVYYDTPVNYPQPGMQ